MEITLQGIPVSPGVGIGPAVVIDALRIEVPQYDVEDVEAEVARLDSAMARARDELHGLHEKTAESLGEAHAAIFKAQALMVDDPVLRDEVVREIGEECSNVEYLLDRLIKRYSDALANAKDQQFRERTGDMMDVANRLLAHLLHQERPDLSRMTRPSVVVAHELHPADAASTNPQQVMGFALDTGSATAHTAILARALGVPAVVGLTHFSGHVTPGAQVIVDGERGIAILSPEADTFAQYEAEQKRLAQQRAALAEYLGRQTSRTRDNVRVPVMANVELPIEISPELSTYAKGIGLYRTEYLFLNRKAPPTEHEHFIAYSQAAEGMAPAPVVLRTMDVGGDKFVSYLNQGRENNPQMGWRAVRFCLERQDIFRTQLRAMLRASVYGDVRVMFPMISGLEELLEVKAIWYDVQQELRGEGVPYREDVPLGSMIEVPSAVSVTDLLAQECDFFSIGTNDLVQYSLAVDRENARIAHLYQPAHPAVLRMLKHTADAAEAAGIPCGICGEMAGDALYTELLVGLGIHTLSMSAIGMPAVRAQLANTTIPECRKVATHAMSLKTASAVRRFLEERLAERGDPLAGLRNMPPEQMPPEQRIAAP